MAGWCNGPHDSGRIYQRQIETGTLLRFRQHEVAFLIHKLISHFILPPFIPLNAPFSYPYIHYKKRKTRLTVAGF